MNSEPLERAEQPPVVEPVLLALVGQHTPDVADDRPAHQHGDHEHRHLGERHEDAGQVEVLRLAGAVRQEGADRDAEDAVDRMPDRLLAGQPVDADQHGRADRPADRPVQRGALLQPGHGLAEQDVEQHEREHRDARLDETADPAELLGDLLAHRGVRFLVAMQVLLLDDLVGDLLDDPVLHPLGRHGGVTGLAAGCHRGASSS
jgi:hypothetical protein